MSFLGKIISALENLVHSHRPMTQEEVDEALTKLAPTKDEPLAWQTSVVDLMKLLNIDSSFQARRALAEELGFSETFVGSELQNEKLHKLVMADVAKRCTKIPEA